jgi:hypothetical protein
MIRRIDKKNWNDRDRHCSVCSEKKNNMEVDGKFIIEGPLRSCNYCGNEIVFCSKCFENFATELFKLISK